jgi:beta-N-acetylhexosaminidase
VSAGQLLIVGFEGTRAPDELLARIAVGRVGGVILFARNLGTLDEIAALVRTLSSAAPGEPLIVAIDQEGGRVQRVKSPFPHWPPMAQAGARAEAMGRAIGDEVGALGFNVDFAPVLDVDSNPLNPIIGDRAFGKTAGEVAERALAFWRGLEASGVRGCAKHFPGHGDTGTDSHLELPRVDKSLEELRACELAPFAAAARAGVPMVMTAHVLYPAVDARPATMSRRWLTDILRGEIGFGGLIVSDDLDMKAIADHFDVAEVAVESLLAGADCFLACRDPLIQKKVEEALDRAAAVDPAVQARLDLSAARMRGFRAGLLRPPSDGKWKQLPLDEHSLLARRG